MNFSRLNLIVILTMTLAAGCGTVPNRNGQADADPKGAPAKTWGMTYYTDGNRAPASMSPPGANGKSEEVIDTTHMRTQADYHYALAESYALEGNATRSIEEYKLTLIYDPNSAVVHLRLAGEFVKKGLVSEATTHAQEAVKLNPNYPEAHLLLGSLYSSVKSYAEAAEQYSQLIRLKPESLDSYLYLGALYAEQGKLDEALKLFEKVSRMPTLNATHVGYYYIGRIYAERKQAQQAEKYFHRSIKAKPDFVDATLSLGALYEKRGDTAKEQKLFEAYQDKYGPSERIAEPLARMYMAKEDYANAYKQYEIIVASDSSNLGAKVKMALIMIEKKDYRRAIAHLEEILAAAPDSDKIRYYLGAVYEEMKNYPLAIENYLRIPSDSSFYEESVSHTAFLQKQAGHPEEAERLMKLAIGQRANVPQFYAIYASLMDDKKDYPHAVEILKTATAKFPQDDQMYFFLGTFYDKAGDKDNSIVAMKKAIELNKKNVQALNYLAYTYADTAQSLDDAETLAKQAVDLKKEDAYIRDTLGWVYYKQGRYADAVRELEFAFKIKSDESVIAEHLGDAYYAFQLVAKARDMYQKAVKLESDVANAKKIRNKLEAIDQSHASDTARLPASF